LLLILTNTSPHDLSERRDNLAAAKEDAMTERGNTKNVSQT